MESKDEDPWPKEWSGLAVPDMPVECCHPRGTAYKLGSDGRLDTEAVDWSRVRLVSFTMTLVDGRGVASPWMKACWSAGKSAPMTVKKDWKMFMAGVKDALQMMKPGEASWFSLSREGQKCDGICRYPVQDEHIYARIGFVGVQYKVEKEQKGFDPRQHFEKILKMKESTDREFSKHRNLELGLDQYTKLWHKNTGFAGQVSKDDALKHLAEAAEQEVLKIRNNLGLICLKSHKLDAALQHLDFVLAREPSNPKALHRKGYCVEALGSWEESLIYFRKVKDIESINRVQSKINSRNRSFLNNLKSRGLF